MAVEIFESVRSLLAKRFEAKIADYRGLVKALSAGKKSPSAEAIVAILEESAKTADDLQADVAVAKQRDVWKAMIDEEPVLEARKSEINREKEGIVQELDRRIREIRAEATAKLDPLKAEEHEIFMKFARVVRESPRARLIETSSLLDEVKAVSNAFPAGGIPTPGTRNPHNITAKERESESCARNVREIERKIDQAKARRSVDPIESIAGFSFKRDQELATLGEQLKLAKENFQFAEADLAKLKSEITTHNVKLQEVEALAIAE